MAASEQQIPRTVFGYTMYLGVMRVELEGWAFRGDHCSFCEHGTTFLNTGYTPNELSRTRGIRDGTYPLCEVAHWKRNSCRMSAFTWTGYGVGLDAKSNASWERSRGA